MLLVYDVPWAGAFASRRLLEAGLAPEVLDASECLGSTVPDLSFIPSSLLANLIPEGLVASAPATSFSSISYPEPYPLPLSLSALSLPGDKRLSIGEAAFCDTPMLSDKLSSPSRSLVYYKGVSEYSCIDALLNGDPLASFLDSDVFTFSIWSFCSEMILAWCSENFCELSGYLGVCSPNGLLLLGRARWGLVGEGVFNTLFDFWWPLKALAAADDFNTPLSRAFWFALAAGLAAGLLLCERAPPWLPTESLLPPTVLLA